MPEQSNDLDICLENLNKPAWWDQRLLPKAAQRVATLLDNLKLNRHPAQDDLWVLLEKSKRLRNHFRAKLENADADSHFPLFVQELVERLVRLRHRGRGLFDSGQNFKEGAKSFAAYLTKDKVFLDFAHRIWENEQEHTERHTSLDEAGEPAVQPGELWRRVREAEHAVLSVLAMEEEADVPACPVEAGIWQRYAVDVKQHLDDALCAFLSQWIQRGKGPKLTQTRRGLWELASRPLPNTQIDSPWPFWRFCVRLLGREYFSPIAQNEPEISKDLAAIGIGGIYVRRNHIRNQLRNHLHARGIDFADQQARDKIAEIITAVKCKKLPSGLEQVKGALEIRTDWEEALFKAVQEHNPRGASLIAALCPPRHDEFYPGLVVALLNKYPKDAIFTALEEEECLLPLLERWEGPASNRPWLAVIPKPERFVDFEAAREWLIKRNWRVLLLTENEDLTLHWPQPYAVVLGALASPDEIGESERAVYESFLNQVHFRDVLECVCLFTAWHRKPLVSQVARILGNGYTPEQVRETVQQSAGLLAFDPQNPEKIMRSDLGWAAARVLQRPHEELVALYSEVLEGLDPGEREDRNAVRNLFTSWYFSAPPRLRLARGVFLKAKLREGGAPKLLEFANREEVKATGDRVRWAEILSFIGEHQEAHDLLLKTPREQENEKEKTKVEALNARIFKTRFRDSGRTLYFNLAEKIYKELIEDKKLRPADADELREQLAELYQWSGKPEEALKVLNQASNGSNWFRQSLCADLLAETDQMVEAERVAAGLPAERKHPLLLERLRGDDWRNYIDSLLDRSRRVAPAALQQAAGCALDRGMFDDARLLLERGLAEAPDNVFLRMTEARLFHERGEFQEALKCFDRILKELVNWREAEVVWITRTESALELFRQPPNKSVLPDKRHRPHPLRGKPSKEDRALNYHLYLIAVEAKFYWYGAEESTYSLNLRSLANDLIGVEDHPFLRSLAARILADPGVKEFAKAREHAEKALERTTGQARIRCLNLLASILKSAAEHAGGVEADQLRQQAVEKLKQSLAIDSENRFTLDALNSLQGQVNPDDAR